MAQHKFLCILAITALHLYRSVSAVAIDDAGKKYQREDSKANNNTLDVDARMQYESLRKDCSSMANTFEEYVRNGSVHNCAPESTGERKNVFEYDMGVQAFRFRQDFYTWSEDSSGIESRGTIWIGEAWQVCKIEFTPEKMRYGLYTLSPVYFPGTRKVKGYDYVLSSGNGGKGLSNRSGIKLKNLVLYGVPIEMSSDYLRKHNCILEPTLLTNVRYSTSPTPSVNHDPVRIEIDVSGTGPVTGNGPVFISNYSNISQTVKYRRTVHNHAGISQEFSITLAPNERKEIGSTCAYDVSYTDLCGSAVSYQLTH